jgi:O-antigen ligase
MSAIFDLLNRQQSLSSADALSGRTEMWQLGISLAGEHPWLGYGLGTEKELVEANSWQLSIAEGFHLHNSYLTLLVETGIIGAVVLFAPPILITFRSFFSLEFRNTPIRVCTTYALPVALSLGALAHGIFETWIFSPGNSNTLLFWICIFLMHKNMKIVRQYSIPNKLVQRSDAAEQPLLSS